VKRRHHFVPQFYLRRFSCDEAKKRIHVYNLKRQAAFRDASVKRQCYRHRFYGKQDDLEDAFSELEGFAAPALTRLIETQRGPQLGSDDHKALIMFVALQHSRTTAAMLRVQSSLNLFANTAFDGSPPPEYLASEDTALTMALDHLPLMMALIDDLRIHIVIAPSGHAFITSDHPVSRYNHYCYGVKGLGVLGLTRRGFQLFMPVAPTVSVLMFDGGVYKVGQRGVAPSSIAVPADMVRLNQLTYLAAHQNLYFASWEQREEIAGEICSVGREAATKPVITEAVEEGDENSVLLHGYEEQPRIEVGLSFLTVRREAKRVHLYERARQYRRPAPLPNMPGPPALADGRTHVFKVKKRVGETS
jgi:hypothetical protein